MPGFLGNLLGGGGATQALSGLASGGASSDGKQDTETGAKTFAPVSFAPLPSQAGGALQPLGNVDLPTLAIIGIAGITLFMIAKKV